MKLNKKGVIFTILALLISSIVVALFFSFKEVPLDNTAFNVKVRIQQINMHITQLEEYIRELTKTSAESALSFAIEEMINKSTYYTDFDSALQSCMVSGVIPEPGNEGSLIECPDAAKLQTGINALTDFAASELTIKSVVRINNVEVAQYNPWDIVLTVNYSIKIEDSYASWDAVKTTNQTVSIIGLKDPTYWIVDPAVASYKYVNTFKRVENQGLWLEYPSTANFATVNALYFKYEKGPSFLNRLRGNITNSTCCGIASIVPPLDSEYTTDLSHLDYIFWQNDVCKSTESGNYNRFNFWKSGMTSGDRLALGIADSGYGLNGSVVPPSFTTFVNMTNTSYIEVINPSCAPS